MPPVPVSTDGGDPFGSDFGFGGGDDNVVKAGATDESSVTAVASTVPVSTDDPFGSDFGSFGDENDTAKSSSETNVPPSAPISTGDPFGSDFGSFGGDNNNMNTSSSSDAVNMSTSENFSSANDTIESKTTDGNGRTIIGGTSVGEDPFSDPSRNTNHSNSSSAEADEVKPPNTSTDNLNKSPPKPPRKPPRNTTANTTVPSEENASTTTTVSQGSTADAFDNNFGGFDATAPTAMSTTTDQNKPTSSNGFDDAWGDFPTTSESSGGQESDPFASSGNDAFGGFDNW